MDIYNQVTRPSRHLNRFPLLLCICKQLANWGRLHPPVNDQQNNLSILRSLNHKLLKAIINSIPLFIHLKKKLCVKQLRVEDWSGRNP